jgi:hypothetical protein
MRACVAMDAEVSFALHSATFGPITAIHFLDRNNVTRDVHQVWVNETSPEVWNLPRLSHGCPKYQTAKRTMILKVHHNV